MSICLFRPLTNVAQLVREESALPDDAGMVDDGAAYSSVNSPAAPVWLTQFGVLNFLNIVKLR